MCLLRIRLCAFLYCQGLISLLLYEKWLVWSQRCSKYIFVISGIVTSSLYQDAIIRISYIFVCWIDSYYDIFVVINVYISSDYIFKILVKPMCELWSWSREWEAKVRSPSNLEGWRSLSVHLQILTNHTKVKESIQTDQNLWKQSVRERNYLFN